MLVRVDRRHDSAARELRARVRRRRAVVVVADTAENKKRERERERDGERRDVGFVIAQRGRGGERERRVFATLRLGVCRNLELHT